MNQYFYSAYDRLIGFLVVVFSISLIAWGMSRYQLSTFPSREEVLPSLFQEPVQTRVSVEPFTIIAENREYRIEPFYAYELYGMVVSYNQSSPLYQIVHWLGWKDFINVKDICVIWGENVQNEIYKGMTFMNATYTCYPRYKNETAWEYEHLYNPYQLSNNHLLSNNKKLKEVLWSSRTGDQVYVKGYLVRYSHSQGAFQRGSSVVRTDTGDGACETIYLTDFKILKENHPVARRVHAVSFWLMVVSFIVYLWMDPFWDTFRSTGKIHSWWHRLMSVSDRRVK